jgi:hypothetical protein
MNETEAVALRRWQPGPILPCRFQQLVRPADVGVDEGGGACDRTVHMAFRREMQHGGGPVFRQHRIHRGTIADVMTLEGVARVARDRVERARIGRIGELVDVDDAGAARDERVAHGRADKARSSGDQNAHYPFPTQSK